ncbi:MAG: hypothetical protein M9951_10250 [Burkholderiaceae bacterium]|nr:hypothetical protein [Burkholderiaceae bacterium]
MQYHLMTDSQGSIISEGAYGTVTQDMAFDAWGKTRDPDAGSDYGLPPEGGWAWHNERLYTGHESHQDQYVINMNGRLYDPVLSRMLSADPFVPGAGNNPQGLNRYAYVFNNPLRYIDPDGFKPFWKKRWFRTVAAVAASIYTAGAAAGWMANYAAYSSAYGTTIFANATLDVVSGVISTSLTTTGFAAAGAAGGFMGGLVASGGNLEAALSGAVTGAAFGWAGSLGSTGEIVTGHAAAGCLSGVVQGGGCGRGATSAVVGKAVTLGIGNSMGNGGKFVAATVAGGISSKVAGGNFAAGAQTAAFGYLFNAALHDRMAGTSRVEIQGNEAAEFRAFGRDNAVGQLTDPDALHLSITIYDSYDGITTIEARPFLNVGGRGCLLCLNSVITNDVKGRIAWGPYGLTSPAGLGADSFSFRLRAYAHSYQNWSTPYFYPRPNSNFWVSDGLQVTTGSVPNFSFGRYQAPGYGK